VQRLVGPDVQSGEGTAEDAWIRLCEADTGRHDDRIDVRRQPQAVAQLQQTAIKVGDNANASVQTTNAPHRGQGVGEQLPCFWSAEVLEQVVKEGVEVVEADPGERRRDHGLPPAVFTAGDLCDGNSGKAQRAHAGESLDETLLQRSGVDVCPVAGGHRGVHHADGAAHPKQGPHGIKENGSQWHARDLPSQPGCGIGLWPELERGAGGAPVKHDMLRLLRWS
jgi:hypothetical protein